MRGRFALAFVSAGLAAIAACSSSLDLGGAADAGAPDVDVDGAPAPTCESVCQKIALCGLLDPGKGDACLAECRSRATPADLECAQSAPCSEVDRCERGASDAAFDSFNAALEAFEITSCQEACSRIQFFDCITAAQHAACRSLCEAAPRTKRNTFEACANGSGSDCPASRDCYDVFVGD